MLQGSYTWSHSYGNFEGLVSSDYNRVIPYNTPSFDAPGLAEHSRGDLPNDRRHNLKLYGTYAWPWGLRAGAYLWYLSGKPVNGFGMHPTDPLTQFLGNRAFYNGGEPCPRGCGGTTDSSWGLDLMLRYELETLGANWSLRVDAFNLFDNDAVIQVKEYAEGNNFLPYLDYRWARFHQRPRSVRLGLGVSF
jgi:hypothetical protein